MWFETSRLEIERHDLISFDVFDTLILRAISKPIGVFALVKLKLLTTRAALHNPRTIEAFPDLRIRAERRARERKQHRHNHSEISFDEIYEEFAELSHAQPDLIDLLKTTELETEHDVVYPNPAMRDLYALALSQQKKVVLCSDMYLPTASIESLLRRCGYSGYDALYVSCDHSQSKHCGAMFAYVAAKHGITTDRILHFGDNEYADYQMAKQAGCGAIHLPYDWPQDGARMPLSNEQPFYFQTVSDIIHGLCRKRSQTIGEGQADPWAEMGYHVFGPLFTGFLLWLKSIIEQNNPEKILLFARDTYFIWQYLNRFLGDLLRKPELHYLYVSRGSILFPSLTDFPPERLWHLFSGKFTRSVGSHLQKMGLDAELLSGPIRASGYDSSDDLALNAEPRMHTLLGKLYEPLLRESAKRRPLVRSYLDGFIGNAQRIMLVDIGWVGNMQGSFIRLLGPSHSDVEVKGYYIGTFKSAKENDYPGHSMQGWLMHYGEPAGLEQELWWSGGVELLEFAMCAPHGTTLGYARKDDGGGEPVLESGEEDRDFLRLAAQVQRGAGEFVEEFLASYGNIPAVGLSSQAWAAGFYRLAMNPTPEEAELLGDLTHSDSAGNTASRLPLAPKVDSDDWVEISKAFERSFWKAGFRVRNGLA